MKVPRLTALWVGSIAALAVLAAVAVLVTSAGVGARTARADTPTTACAPGTDVTIDSGPICGASVNGTNEWFGIPYAAPPVGALRWQPPQPATPWSTTLQATQFGSECTQSFGTTTLLGSEDCLFVNVWGPADGSTGLPVLVHIHGGGFVFGSGNGDNSLLSSTGHEVVVSFNYRLGIFGFLAEQALGANSGDYGLQDQQAALRWVQNNIARFGGDPANVTIYGESAGGSSVCDQIASPTANGLFERGISVSGEYNTLLGSPNSLEQQDCKSQIPTKAQAVAAGKNFAAAAGCGPGTPDVAACLRNLSPTTAQTIAGGGVVGGFFPVGYQDGGQGTVGPTINGTTLKMTLRQALATGHVNHVDVIAGTDRDENLVGTATTAAQYQNLVDTQYGSFASEVLAKYPLSHFDNPGLAWRTVAADSDTVCPSLEIAKALASRMPTREYEIDDNDLPPYRASGPGVVAPGASHVGGWFLTPVTPALDANQQVLQDQELAFVTAFARNGNPNTTGVPVWPRLNNTNDVMSLQPAGDSELVTTDEMATQHNCAFWDRVAKHAP
ncbi:MAG: carboxylesterase family protein [Solirubrobacterales bacterium]|nr:carboxylesterase family protein [Solirubrobacterales bacterium]MBV9367381.1 carboxylesterase family protein [Solirubrobacterales bacterium]MBV9809492.1 carboxylesterase family protein [Solirubrobacterales bacterium]